ncbi:MAG: ornithine cyclodeaminase family protein [Dehalococcoidales bacterium]|nr:MAG: ornithine cyclodeaminase family protein [Dehalococcoidales bacterium]
MPTLILSKNEMRGLLSMPEVIEVVEEAFRDWTQGKGNMPPKAYLSVDQGDFRAMPVYLPGVAGLKWVNVHTANLSRGLPTVMAVWIHNDPETGYPLAVMDATDITAYRTGATAAIASKYLARQDSHTLGIIGAGRQAYTQIQAHAELFEIHRINVFDLSETTAEKLMQSFPEYSPRKSTLEEATTSDIVCTLTPSREALLKKEWVQPGTHINAIGADAEGKEELEPSILKEAMVVVDDIRQAAAAGEINMPITRGQFTVDNVYATLGDIVTGKKQGRIDPEAISVFDSTGVAIEDAAVARLVYEKARHAGTYQSLDLVDG